MKLSRMNESEPKEEKGRSLFVCPSKRTFWRTERPSLLFIRASSVRHDLLFITLLLLLLIP